MPEKIKIQVKSIYGTVLFEYEKENNTLRDTVIEAVRQRADLSGADLSGANLSGAYLSGADLSGAYLRDADLSGADLSGAYLRDAYLRDADLMDAYLRGADLRGADLRDAKNADLPIAMTRILPEGDLVVYKSAYSSDDRKVIIKLRIPADAKRSSAFGRKCRAEFAEVLEIDGGPIAYSGYDRSFTYEVGKIVKPLQPFDENWQAECGSGIHFFITRFEAENYNP